MFNIEFLPDAEEDLAWFRKHEQVRIRDEIREQLSHQPGAMSRKRKRLKGRHVSEWELRIGNLRAFYDIDAEASLVTIVAVGYKDRSKLFFQGEVYEP